MLTARSCLLLLLAVFGTAFCAVWRMGWARSQIRGFPSIYELLTGFVTDFLDTLGIGSFAVTTSLFRWRRTVPDELLPGTLNVGHCLPTIVQALIYITIVEVEIWTLVLTIAASVLGAWIGASVVCHWSKRHIQIGMGLALLVAAGLMLAKIAQALPGGADSHGLTGISLVIAIAANFAFGALMTVGVGAYAPIMIMVSLLGMNPKAAFPIMMGSCAFLMPIAGVRFIQTERYHARAALGLTCGGIPGVLIAAFVVYELRLDVLRWLVLAIVLYTAVSMLLAAIRGSRNVDRT